MRGGSVYRRARRARKVLGGGMRQAGVLAAAGIIALEEMVARLAEDHANARCWPRASPRCPAFRSIAAGVQTNIIIFSLDHPHLGPAELRGPPAPRGWGF